MTKIRIPRKKKKRFKKQGAVLLVCDIMIEAVKANKVCKAVQDAINDLPPMESAFIAWVGAKKVQDSIRIINIYIYILKSKLRKSKSKFVFPDGFYKSKDNMEKFASRCALPDCAKSSPVDKIIDVCTNERIINPQRNVGSYSEAISKLAISTQQSSQMMQQKHNPQIQQD